MRIPLSVYLDWNRPPLPLHRNAFFVLIFFEQFLSDLSIFVSFFLTLLIPHSAKPQQKAKVEEKKTPSNAKKPEEKKQQPTQDKGKGNGSGGFLNKILSKTPSSPSLSPQSPTPQPPSQPQPLSLSSSSSSYIYENGKRLKRKLRLDLLGGLEWRALDMDTRYVSLFNKLIATPSTHPVAKLISHRVSLEVIFPSCGMALLLCIVLV